jgi:hypothetical protein
MHVKKSQNFDRQHSTYCVLYKYIPVERVLGGRFQSAATTLNMPLASRRSVHYFLHIQTLPAKVKPTGTWYPVAHRYRTHKQTSMIDSCDGVRILRCNINLEQPEPKESSGPKNKQKKRQSKPCRSGAFIYQHNLV